MPAPKKRGRPRIHPLPDPDAPKRKRGGQPKPPGTAKARPVSFRPTAPTLAALEAEGERRGVSPDRAAGDVVEAWAQKQAPETDRRVKAARKAAP